LAIAIKYCDAEKISGKYHNVKILYINPDCIRI
jgi:hypothetical protein